MAAKQDGKASKPTAKTFERVGRDVAAHFVTAQAEQARIDAHREEERKKVRERFAKESNARAKAALLLLGGHIAEARDIARTVAEDGGFGGLGPESSARVLELMLEDAGRKLEQGLKVIGLMKAEEEGFFVEGA